LQIKRFSVLSQVNQRNPFGVKQSRNKAPFQIQNTAYSGTVFFPSSKPKFFVHSLIA
jgi:hypothetical protein